MKLNDQCPMRMPDFRASRQYSYLIAPLGFGLRIRLPRSQRSQAANSSFGDSVGCDSLWPLIWVTS